MRQIIMLIVALIFGGCVTAPVATVCSKYPCEWSKPVVKGKTGIPAPDYTETAKMYLCLEPTRAYPVMPKVTCI